jgi:hypothetical protein
MELENLQRYPASLLRSLFLSLLRNRLLAKNLSPNTEKPKSTSKMKQTVNQYLINLILPIT